MESSRWIDAVFVRQNFPKLGSDLITALTHHEAQNFTHLDSVKVE